MTAVIIIAAIVVAVVVVGAIFSLALPIDDDEGGG